MSQSNTECSDRGRRAELAVAELEIVTGSLMCNVGLTAEEVDAGGEMIGNFPQAFTTSA
jgi:hypothetical protein